MLCENDYRNETCKAYVKKKKIKNSKREKCKLKKENTLELKN